jgi:hypothetical protein
MVHATYNDYFLFEKHVRAVKKARRRKSAGHGWTVYDLGNENPELCPPDFNIGGRSTNHVRMVHNLGTSIVQGLTSGSPQYKPPITHSPGSNTFLNSCGRSTQLRDYAEQGPRNNPGIM